MEIHCARTTRAGGHAPLGNEEMRNVTTRPVRRTIMEGRYEGEELEE
jgi:hypothetical protein